MNWKCDKCGKSMEISSEQLTETQGVVVCPQCLSSSVIPGYKRKTLSAQTGRASAEATRKRNSAPPPYKKQSITFASAQNVDEPNRKVKTSVSTQKNNPKASASLSAAKKKTTTKRKRKGKRGCLAPHSAWGCLWRTVLWTAVLLTVYVIFGMILDAAW